MNNRTGVVLFKRYNGERTRGKAYDGWTHMIVGCWVLCWPAMATPNEMGLQCNHLASDGCLCAWLSGSGYDDDL